MLCLQATTRVCAGNKAPSLTKEHEHTASKLIFVQQGGNNKGPKLIFVQQGGPRFDLKDLLTGGPSVVVNISPVTGMESLIIIPTSKAQALQRSGRAGREGPGKCFQLYPESEFGKLADSTVPEIKRCNLSNVVLQLKALGIDDVIGFVSWKNLLDILSEIFGTAVPTWGFD
ncbi:hypothetical protein ZIOFF_046340 [Zingiber officinale]|uniref:RNA helicase n=1 Tax=Zingiber officinale TaxID=94328 RepID=A0A8J5G4X5_ZINOF|nr:hypothetical protein ZIOFF_046340 [Zingiber officinale]